jgi:hypothetical protein
MAAPSFASAQSEPRTNAPARIRGGAYDPYVFGGPVVNLVL